MERGSEQDSAKAWCHPPRPSLKGSGRATQASMMMLVVKRMLLVAAGIDVRDEVEDFLARQLVQEALGHHRRGRFLAIIDVRNLQDHRFDLEQRVFDYFDGFMKIVSASIRKVKSVSHLPFCLYIVTKEFYSSLSVKLLSDDEQILQCA